ncbi:MAG: signal recognition particle-docking protein FtsY [Proteobacteria bacterium]|nr:signal recognition particle-docking protein FtsY [Pseudomonadota bacterium]
MSWFSRITSGLKKTAANLGQGVKAAVGLSKKLDAQTREALEEALISADVGLPVAQALISDLQKKGIPEPLTEDSVKAALADLIESRLQPLAQPLLPITNNESPITILIAGVNGSGKTTTIGKLAAQWARQGHHVIVAAADTFRAAAVEQLKVWTDRAADASKKKGSVTIIPPAKEGADPAGVAFAALEQAQKDKADIVLIDTAGRLPNRSDLLAELTKITRVVKKLDASAPHATILVLDSTLGQSTLPQVRQFHEASPVTGLIITKLDGSAKAGFLLALAAEPNPLPVHAIGFGESLDDLGPFNAKAYARALVGLPAEE